ncbi:hypothetical protein D3C71_1951930 [compost metagenome]
MALRRPNRPSSGAFLRTDSIPFSALALDSYISLVRTIWPLVASKLKTNLSFFDFFSSNFAAIGEPSG